MTLDEFKKLIRESNRKQQLKPGTYVALSVFNKDCGVISTRFLKRKIGPQTIYSMIEKLQYRPGDRILVEICPNIENRNDYRPFIELLDKAK